jgi:predicted O-methyltransferase YrrM
VNKDNPKEHFFAPGGRGCHFCGQPEDVHAKLPAFDGSADKSAQKILDTLRPYWESQNTGGFMWPPVQNYYEHYALWASLIKPGAILEIGIMYGWSVMAMLLGWPDIQDIVLIDSELYGIPVGDTKQRIADFCADQGIRVPRIHAIKMNTRQHTELALAGTFGLIHIDGEHSKEAVQNDIKLTAPYLSKYGTMIIDDISLPGIREGAHLALDELDHLTYREAKSTQTHYLIWEK